MPEKQSFLEGGLFELLRTQKTVNHYEDLDIKVVTSKDWLILALFSDYQLLRVMTCTKQLMDVKKIFRPYQTSHPKGSSTDEREICN